jgi:uncharacterized protein (TIGR02466 family)
MDVEGRRWMAESDVMPMFATLVWKIRLEAGLRDALNSAIVDTLDELRRGLPRLERGQGWQSSQALHERDALRPLFACVERAAAGILRFLRVGDEALEVTACWATVLAPGAAHKLHNHPNNFLSGVYYLRTPSGADTICFHDPRPQASVIRPPVIELSAENTDQVVVRVEPGTLLLFPSYFEHSVDANASDEERVSLSFNLMFSAFETRLSKPLWGSASRGEEAAIDR